MFKPKWSFQQVQAWLSQLGQEKLRIILILFSLLPWTLSAAPAMALLTQLGVVKSPENASNWSEIKTRLQATGLNYCILDVKDWQDDLDLSSVSVLLLPNVSILNGAQGNALERWMNQGGKVIVTGPTGTLSQPEVREKLRSLLGAHWGYTLSSPSTLQVEQSEWTLQSNLESTLIGGVVIPSGLNSQTAAIWLADAKSPAVVITDQATFLGWRWGIDGVSSSSLDIAWLEVSLNHLGFNRNNILASLKRSEPSSCNADFPSTTETGPFLPNLQKQHQSKQQKPNKQQQVIPPGQLAAMNQELYNLISRFQSSLLDAEATNSNINLTTSKAIEQFLSGKGSNSQSPAQYSVTSGLQTNSGAYRALNEAKQRFQQFQQLINQQQYTKATQQWMQARRTLWDSYPTNRQLAQPEIRAMWLDRGTITKAKSEADLAKVFDRLAEAGINTVFFETVNASYPIYPSQIARIQNPLTVGWDPLQAAVKLAHERNMELHAWVWMFAAANQGHNTVLNQPQDYLGPILSARPDWAMNDQQGRMFHPQSKKAFFDPANPEVRRYLWLLLDEIATRYDVDGIQIDYIRYPFQNPNINQTFGYGPASRSMFKQMTGVDPMEISPSHPLWSQWTGFRIRQIDSFVATASQRLKQKRPDLIFSAAVFPMPQRDRLFRLQQNWEEWARNGWVDMVVLMTYALDTDNLEDMTQLLFDESISQSTILLPGIRLLKVPDPVTVDQMQLLRNLPTSGYALFAAENLTPNLQRIFNRTQGSTQSTQEEPLPYREPFQAVNARYQAMQQEWSFLLATNQLVMEVNAMKEWGKRSDALGGYLNTLAQQPSASNLADAKAALTGFRRQFDTWMAQQKTTQPYQVEVWENNLETLERLLSYGERVVFQQNRSGLAKR